MAAENTCVICLEHLTSGVIGAAVPCGHCFHEECFERWRVSKHGNASWYDGLIADVKCPMCSTIARSFCRIYLDLDKMGGDDSVSLSSDEAEPTEEESTKDAAQERSVTSEVVEEASQQPEEDPLSGAEIIVIDDADVAPRRTSQSATSSSSEKYKAKAKRLKRRVKILEVQRAGQAQELEEIKDKYVKSRKRLDSLETEMEDIVQENEDYEREREGTSLQLVQLRRENREIAGKLERATTDKEKAQMLLLESRKDHARELERVQAKNMIEVQSILTEYPKLNQENRNLKQTLEQVKKRFHELQREVESQHGGASKPRPVAQPTKPQVLPMRVGHTRDALEVLHQLGELDAAQLARKHAEKRRQKEERNAYPRAEMQGKLSSHALRFSKPEKKNHTNSLELLERDYQNNEPKQKRLMSHQPKNLGALKRVKPASGQFLAENHRMKDIRNHFQSRQQG